MAESAAQGLVFAIRGPVAPADLDGLCDRVCALLASCPAAVVDCDVAGVPADAGTVDALARLQLAAQRTRCRVRLRNASAELRELVALMGLADVLPFGSDKVLPYLADAVVAIEDGEHKKALDLVQRVTPQLPAGPVGSGAFFPLRQPRTIAEYVQGRAKLGLGDASAAKRHRVDQSAAPDGPGGTSPNK